MLKHFNEFQINFHLCTHVKKLFGDDESWKKKIWNLHFFVIVYNNEQFVLTHSNITHLQSYTWVRVFRWRQIYDFSLRLRVLSCLILSQMLLQIRQSSLVIEYKQMLRLQTLVSPHDRAYRRFPIREWIIPSHQKNIKNIFSTREIITRE